MDCQSSSRTLRECGERADLCLEPFLLDVVICEFVPPVTLRLQVVTIGVANATDVLDALHIGDSCCGEVIYLLRIVRQQTKRFVPEKILDERGGITEISRIVRQPERSICLVSVFSRVLQHVGCSFGPKADTTSLMFPTCR